MTLRCILSLSYIVFIFIISPVCSGEMVFSRHPSVIEGDSRHVWYDKVLELALKKTEAEYGPFSFKLIPNMDNARTWRSIRSNRYPNLLYAVPYDRKTSEDEGIIYAEFPLQLGLLGFRVCLTSAEKKSYIDSNFSVDMVRKLNIGQGSGWEDVVILRSNGFEVVEVQDYAHLFKMTSASRFDLFCRGVNEVHDEYILHKKSLPIHLDRKFALQYPFPVFFHANKQNKIAVERAQIGLERAYADGSLLELFRSYYEERLQFVQLWDRKIIKLKNPAVKGLSVRYKQYNLTPLQFFKMAPK